MHFEKAPQEFCTADRHGSLSYYVPGLSIRKNWSEATSLHAWKACHVEQFPGKDYKTKKAKSASDYRDTQRYYPTPFLCLLPKCTEFYYCLPHSAFIYLCNTNTDKSFIIFFCSISLQNRCNKTTFGEENERLPHSSRMREQLEFYCPLTAQVSLSHLAGYPLERYQCLPMGTNAYAA